MTDPSGLIYAGRLDGKGGAEEIDTWAGIAPVDDAMHWVHFNWEAEDARQWLREKSGLRPLIQEALLAQETRPRCNVLDEGILLNLRGVNLNPGAEPEDMVSIRLWLEPKRMVSSRARKLMAIQDIRDALGRGEGPQDVGGFVIKLADRLTARMEPLIESMQDQLDDLEDKVVSDMRRELRTELTKLRRRTILLRRYIAPQREALRQLAHSGVDWITDRQQDRLNEIADRVTRYVEEMDVIRDRAAIIHDELVNLLTERMDRTMYLLSIVATIFLPLGLISGMLGMNVGGIPGEKWPWAFAFLCGVFLVLGIVELWLIRRLRWL